MYEGVVCAMLGRAIATGALYAAKLLQVRRCQLLRISLLLAAVCTVVQAQVPVDGSLRGTVMDVTSRVIIGADVRVTDDSRGLIYIAHSDDGGRFFLPHLPVGMYSLRLTAQGFATQAVNSVIVEAGGVAELALRLRAGGAEETISVVDSASALEQPAGSAVTSVFPASAFDELPLNGRRWQSFALLTPAINAADGDLGTALLSARGLAVTQNSSALDGVNNDNSFHGVARGDQSADVATSNDESSPEAEPGAEPGGAHRGSGSWRRSGAAYTFSQAAVREFRVSTQNYSALYGHGAGASIATVSKSGTNALHGSAFYIARSSALAATNPFAVATRYHDGAIASSYVKPHDLRQQFGGTMGGAAVHDRLFYFYAYDQQRRGFAGISSPEDPAFYALTPTQRALLANRGVPSAKINAALNYIDSLTGKVNRRDDQTINFLKLDWQAAAKHHVSAQYNRLRSAVPAGLRGAPVIDRGVASLGSGYTKVDSFAARWTWAASAHLYNEARFAQGHDLQFEQAQQPLPQEPAIGINGYAPQIAIAPYGFSFGTPADVGRNAYPDEHRTQAIDTVSWSRSAHLLQAGIEFSAIHDEVSSLNNTVGTFRYDSGATNGRAGGLVDWITDYTFNVNSYPNGGCPSIYAAVHLFCFQSYTQSFGEESVAWRTQDWAGFVQESWRPRANLTLNAGVRYEYELLPIPQRVNTALDLTFGERGATGIFPEDRNNFGPRVGLAWAPFGEARGIVRLGYGVYYGRVTGATVRSALVNTALTASSLHIRITPSTVTACPQVANQGFGYVCSYPAAPPSAIASTTSATVFSRRFRTPMVQQGSLAIERSVGRGLVLSATYLMNIDHQLQGSRDMNISPSTATKIFQLVGGTSINGVRNGDRFALPVYSTRINDSFGPVTAITSNVNASYNALALEAQHRSRGGLMYRVAWTWSKAVDESQSAGGSPRINSQLDPFDIRYDKGLSRLNFPHKLVVSAAWSPRIRTQGRTLYAVANGWTASGIFYETSGRPYSYEISGGDRLAGGYQSINGAGGAIYLPTVGRNTLRLPDTARLDLRLARAFRVTERVRAHATMEAFNLFNRVNYTGVQQRAFLAGDEAGGVTPLVFQDAAAIAAEGLNVRPFGVYSEAGSNNSRERQLQLRLQLEF
jgi:hypothetical protein